MKPLLIGLHGKARSGKDTTGHFLSQHHAFELYAFAGPLKRGISTMFNLPHGIWDSTAKEQPIEWLGKSPRQLAQTLGTEWGRQMVDHALWTKLMLRRWDHVKQLSEPRLCVTDVRFDDEAEAIKLRGGRIIHIVRDNAPAVNPHVSELGIDGKYIDHRILNTGTLQELKNSTDEVVEMHLL